MCGRYSNKFDQNKLKIRYGLPPKIPAVQPNQNLRPTDQAPVILAGAKGPEIHLMKWGLIPFWAKDPKVGQKCINARAEGLDVKPAFRDSFKRKRCLIPADSFYEWGMVNVEGKKYRKDDGYGNEWRIPPHQEKRKFQIRVKGMEIFSMAGLWDTWLTPNGEPIESYTIITTEPNERIAPLHNRMPVILHRDQELVWLNPKFDNPTLLKGLLKPYPAEFTEVEETGNGFLSL